MIKIIVIIIIFYFLFISKYIMHLIFIDLLVYQHNITRYVKHSLHEIFINNETCNILTSCDRNSSFNRLNFFKILHWNIVLPAKVILKAHNSFIGTIYFSCLLDRNYKCLGILTLYTYYCMIKYNNSYYFLYYYKICPGGKVSDWRHVIEYLKT